VTFLELVQDACRYAGGVSGVPASIEAVTGDHLRVRGWVNQAWLWVQRKHADWKFMRREFSFQTTAGQGDYTVAQVLANEPADERTVARWGFWPPVVPLRYYLTSAGQATEQWVTPWAWDDFKEVYRFGAQASQQGAPLNAAVKPDKSLAFGFIPDAAYTISGDYWLAARPMAIDDAAVPGSLPEEYHELLVWLAIWRYGGYDESSATYTHAVNMASPILDALERDQLPDLEDARPLV